MITKKNNILYFDGANTVDLAKKFKTPLYVVSENLIINKCQEIQNSFLKKYNNTKAVYASKAFLPLAMCKIIEKQGLGLDVVSGGELYTAIKANFPMEMIEFNGNNKSKKEIELAIEHNVGLIIVDNHHELALIKEISKKMNKITKILFRITPGVESDTHDYITTGNKDSKFGIPLDTENIYPIVKEAINSNLIDFKGIHFHIGSQLLSNDSYLNAINTGLDLIKDIKEKYNYDIKEFNIGGGFGIKYLSSDNPPPLSYFIDPIMKKFSDYCKNNSLLMPKIIIEPGRWIIGEAGITLYKLGSIKDIPNVRKYISVDGGMTDNIRPALYNAEYRAMVANNMTGDKTEKVTIAGKMCESGDILIKDIELPIITPGDTLAIFSTGAYGYSMANNYNKALIPSVVLVKDGEATIIVKRQTYKDLLRNDIVPKHLQ